MKRYLIGKHPGDEELVDLALGMLAYDRADDVRLHLAVCPPCTERFHACTSEIERLRAGATEAISDPRPSYGRASRWIANAWHAVARSPGGVSASVVLAAGLLMVIVLAKPASRDPASLLHWLPDGGEIIVTREAVQGADDRSLKDGLSAYSERNMPKALAALATMSGASGPEADMAQIYYGSALAWTGQYGDAVHHLSKVETETLPEPWRGETEWTLYVALLGSGEDEVADALLKVIASRRGEAADRARRILRLR
jgi:hypothetical protein